MRPTLIRTIAAGLLLLFTLPGGAAAQKTESVVLNSLELQQLIKRGDPADHARVAAHFTALAEQYALDAKRHAAMARAFTVQPAGRTAAHSAADHCNRLAELNTESAATLRELAAHHERLAAGEASTAPRGAARFQNGEGATAPTPEDLRALAARANTRTDHLALAEYFDTVAKRNTAAADQHAAMAQTYRGTRIAQAAAHCERLVKLSRDSAEEAREAADFHRDLAAVAR
jgi:hypothetical protein